MRERRKNTAERPVSGSESTQRDYAEYREPETVTVSLRVEKRDRDAIEAHAADLGIKPSQLLRQWIRTAMKREGLR
jgi:hypothetical protein